MTPTVHPIERESYRILRSLVDLSHLPPLSRAVCERVVHASADLDYARTLVLDEAALQRGREALAAGAPVVADVGMVASGVTSRSVRCLVDDPRTRARASAEGLTRSAAALRLAASEVGSGAVWVVGSAPTALTELVRLSPEPALVIGLPVGFVGAADSKAALAASGLPCLTNRGAKGGSAVAAAALNALLYHESEEADDR
jgi:precorrin-8X/cobalt-precorrin-8 methylmutase